MSYKNDQPTVAPVISGLNTLKKMKVRRRKLFEEAAIIMTSASAERELLAHIAHGGIDALYRATGGGVQVSDFEHDGHAEIFTAMMMQAEAHGEITSALVSSALVRLGATHENFAGIHEAAASLFEEYPATAYEEIIAEVLDMSLRRTAQVQGLRIAHHAGRLTPEQIAAQFSACATTLHGAAEDGLREAEGSSPFLQWMASRKEIMDGNGPPDVIFPLGIEELDECLGGGLRHGHIYHVAAPEKTGKSQFVNWMKMKLLMGERDVFIDDYSVEMSRDEIFALMLASACAEATIAMGLDFISQDGSYDTMGLRAHAPTFLEVYRGKAMNSQRLARAVEAHGPKLAERMERYRFRLIEGQSVEWIAERVRLRVESYRAEHGADAPYVMVVDYGQDLATEQKVWSDVKAAERVSAVLRGIAKSLHIAVVVVLHTGGDADPKKNPGSHIHGSRQWMKDTSGAIVLWRPLQYKDEPWQWCRAQVVRARIGQPGYVDLYADVSRASFSAWQHETPPEIVKLLEEQETKR